MQKNRFCFSKSNKKSSNSNRDTGSAVDLHPFPPQHQPPSTLTVQLSSTTHHHSKQNHHCPTQGISTNPHQPPTPHQSIRTVTKSINSRNKWHNSSSSWPRSGVGQSPSLPQGRKHPQGVSTQSVLGFRSPNNSLQCNPKHHQKVSGKHCSFLVASMAPGSNLQPTGPTKVRQGMQPCTTWLKARNSTQSQGSPQTWPNTTCREEKASKAPLRIWHHAVRHRSKWYQDQLQVLLKFLAQDSSIPSCGKHKGSSPSC